MSDIQVFYEVVARLAAFLQRNYKEKGAVVWTTEDFALGLNPFFDELSAEMEKVSIFLDNRISYSVHEEYLLATTKDIVYIIGKIRLGTKNDRYRHGYTLMRYVEKFYSCVAMAFSL